MNYADIRPIDVANGPGVRVSLFVSGCTHHCKECFNPETWDFHYGAPFTAVEEEAILKHLAPAFIGKDPTNIHETHRLMDAMIRGNNIPKSAKDNGTTATKNYQEEKCNQCI